jgi:hypothetical protein
LLILFNPGAIFVPDQNRRIKVFFDSRARIFSGHYQ